jgi:hypothetical protein
LLLAGTAFDESGCSGFQLFVSVGGTVTWWWVSHQTTLFFSLGLFGVCICWRDEKK